MKSFISLHRIELSHCRFHMCDNATPQIKINKEENLFSVAQLCIRYCSFFVLPVGQSTARPSPSFRVITAYELAYNDGAAHKNFCHKSHVHLISSESLDNSLLSRSS